MPVFYPISLFPDFRAFHRALFFGREYEPKVAFYPSPETDKPSPPDWYSFYGTCVGYVTSLHNQFIAVLSIQGALAIGSLAALEVLTERGVSGPILGGSVAATELALLILAIKLFRQHCVICWMLRRVEQENQLGLPSWAGMKALLGTAGNRLFTSPFVYLVSIVYGVFLALGLAIASFRG